MNRWVVIIKQDAVKNKKIGAIISELERFNIVEMRTGQFSVYEAETLYEEHKEREGFGDLIDFMIEGDNVFILMENKAVKDIDWTAIKDLKNELRKDFGTFETVCHNAVHMSDSAEAAEREIGLFFFNTYNEW